MEVVGHGDQGHGDEVVFHGRHHDLNLHSREKSEKGRDVQRRISISVGDGALAPRLAVAGFGLAEEEMKNGKDQRRKKK